MLKAAIEFARVTALVIFDRAVVSAIEFGKFLLYSRFRDGVSTDDSTNFAVEKSQSDQASVSELKSAIFFKPFGELGAAIDNDVKSLGKFASEAVSATDSGSGKAQGYCDITYFAEDYVGTTFTF